MSNRLFQGLIYQMKDTVDRMIGVIDENGVVVSCSELTKIGELCPGAREELAFGGDVVRVDGMTYRPLGGARAEYAVFVAGEDAVAENVSAVVAVALSNMKGMYDEKYDRNSLIKNIILDNILPSDIYIKSKELRFSLDVERTVFLFKFQSSAEAVPFDMVMALFPDKTRDNLISVGEHDVVLVKELSSPTEVKVNLPFSYSATVTEALGTQSISFIVSRSPVCQRACIERMGVAWDVMRTVLPSFSSPISAFLFFPYSNNSLITERLAPSCRIFSLIIMILLLS